MDRLKGKVAVVIGAGQSPGEAMGNGRATTIRFAQEGAAVLAVDLDIDSARESVAMAVATDSRVVGEAFEADVTRTESLKAASIRQWLRVLERTLQREPSAR